MERWEQLYEFPDYEVSTYGRFRNIRTKRLLSVSSNGQGVLKIVLTKDRKTYTRSAARLVATTFHGDPREDSVAIYLDDDYTNLREENLEWKPRWFAQKRAIQRHRTEPLRLGRIQMLSTGQVYENALECAKAIDGIEDYIIIAASDPENRSYMGSHYRWAD